MTRLFKASYLLAVFRANIISASATKKAHWVRTRARAPGCVLVSPSLPPRVNAACPAPRSAGSARVRSPREAALSRVAQAQCPRAKMAARCSTRWLLVAVGTPRLPAAARRGARPPMGGVVGASLGRSLSVPAFAPSLGARGPGALLTLRPGVSLTGECRLQRLSEGLQGLERSDSLRSDYGGSGVERVF